jgi:hypothetical protein
MLFNSPVFSVANRVVTVRKSFVFPRRPNSHSFIWTSIGYPGGSNSTAGPVEMCEESELSELSLVFRGRSRVAGWRGGIAILLPAVRAGAVSYAVSNCQRAYIAGIRLGVPRFVTQLTVNS